MRCVEYVKHHNQTNAWKCVCVCVCISLNTSLLSLEISSYRWPLHKGSGLMSQEENIIVALTSVWKLLWAGAPRAATSQDSISLVACPNEDIQINNEEDKGKCAVKHTFSEVTLLGWSFGEKVAFVFFFLLRSGPWSVYLRRCETVACFLKEQQSLRYCPGTALQCRTSLTQIHIKVCPAEKEMLWKCILKRNMTSLSCHQGDSGVLGVWGWTTN